PLDRPTMDELPASVKRVEERVDAQLAAEPHFVEIALEVLMHHLQRKVRLHRVDRAGKLQHVVADLGVRDVLLSDDGRDVARELGETGDGRHAGLVESADGLEIRGTHARGTTSSRL